MERNNKLTKISQTLRKNQTKEEALLWNAFLKKYPLQFRRQYVIGEYIVDFYCHKAKLVIELDGSGHYEPEAQQKDKTRTLYLESQGLFVLRFTNLEIIRYFRAVCEKNRLNNTATCGRMRTTENFAVPHPTRLCRATFPPGEGIFAGGVMKWHIIAAISLRISGFRIR